MDNPELIIPVRMDINGVTQALQKIGLAEQKAGDEIAAGAEKIKKGLDNARTSAGGFGNELVALTKIQLGLKIGGQVTGAITDQFRKASDHVRVTAKEFIELRQTMQQIAALTGQKNQSDITPAQAVAAASLTQSTLVGFQEQFQRCAGAYSEGNQRRSEVNQAEDNQSKIA